MLESSPLAGAALAVAFSSTCSAGTTWIRSADWTDRPPEDIGTSNGNPDDDANGDPVWTYERVESTGGLGDLAPWYVQTPTPLVWDAAWFGSDARWVRLEDTAPSISASELAHVIRADLADQVPQVRWSNPQPGLIRLRIEGGLTVVWSGVGGMGAPVDVDVVLARTQTGSGDVAPLFAETVQKPTPVVGPVEDLMLPVGDLLLRLEAGESIIITLRNQTSVAESHWVLLDDDLVIEEICPGDANADGMTNFADITSVLNNWLDDFGVDTGFGDADANGLVNFADITSVLINWLDDC